MELKPCPFCGGKTLYVIKDHSDFSPLMFCNWCKATVTWEPIEDEEATQEVVADLKRRWNTRAERTCHDLGGTGANDEQVFNCSECGCVLSLYDRDGSNNLCTSFVFDYPRYCPECGRKVSGDGEE